MKIQLGSEKRAREGYIRGWEDSKIKAIKKISGPFMEKSECHSNDFVFLLHKIFQKTGVYVAHLVPK